MKARVYRMTISSTWYDKKDQKAKVFELHYTVAGHGQTRTIRRHLTKRCIPHFQQTVYRYSKRWVRKGKIKVGFEREQPALRSQQERRTMHS